MGSFFLGSIYDVRGYLLWIFYFRRYIFDLRDCLLLVFGIYFVFLSIWSRRMSPSLFHVDIHWVTTKGIFLAFLWGLYSSGGSFPRYTLCTFMECVPLYIIMEGIPFDFLDKLHDYEGCPLRSFMSLLHSDEGCPLVLLCLLKTAWLQRVPPSIFHVFIA